MKSLNYDILFVPNSLRKQKKWVIIWKLVYFIYIWIIISFENTHPSFLHVMLTTSWSWAVTDPFRWRLHLLALNHPHISDMSGLLFTHLCNLLGTSKCISLRPLPGMAYKVASVWRGMGLVAGLSVTIWVGGKSGGKRWEKGKLGSCKDRAWQGRPEVRAPGITLGKTHNCTLCVSGISRLWLHGLELKPWFTKLEAGCAYGL